MIVDSSDTRKGPITLFPVIEMVAVVRMSCDFSISRHDPKLAIWFLLVFCRVIKHSILDQSIQKWRFWRRDFRRRMSKEIVPCKIWSYPSLLWIKDCPMKWHIRECLWFGINVNTDQWMVPKRGRPSLKHLLRQDMWKMSTRFVVMSFYRTNTSGLIDNLCQFLSNGEILTVSVFFSFVWLDNDSFWWILKSPDMKASWEDISNLLNYFVKRYSSVILWMIVKMENVLWTRTNRKACVCVCVWGGLSHLNLSFI